MENTVDSIYKEFILDLYRNPLNKGVLGVYDVRKKGFNPSCGDEIDITIKIDNDTVSNIQHDGVGCAISQVAASLVTDDIKGKNIEAVMGLRQEDVMNLLRIPIEYTRMKCAMLALQTIQDCLKSK